jgi:hypothetical protein
MPTEPVWHRAKDSAALSKLLLSLGLLGENPNGYAVGGPTTLPQAGAAPAAAPTVTPAAAPTAALKTDQSSFSGWRWSIPGFLLGAVLVFVALRLLPRRRPWELIDEE